MMNRRDLLASSAAAVAASALPARAAETIQMSTLAGLDYLAAQDNGIEWLLSVPGDCPFLPDDLVERLHEARRKMGAGVPLACARSGEWRHPVVGLWPLALREDLRKALTVEGLHKIEIWTSRHGVAIADWPDQPVDPFFNVNTPEDAAKAEKLAAGG